MATDVEESDTDDYERPAPPKRQRTRCIKVDENLWDTDKQSSESEDTTIQDAEAAEYDDIERHARRKLKRWQACQMAKGVVDNTINRLLEAFMMAPPTSYPSEDSRFRLRRVNDMEDTAVMMAICRHGLVQSEEFASQYWTNNGYSNVPCSYPFNYGENTEDFTNSMAATSMNSLRLNNSEEVSKYEGVNLDKTDDSNQQEDFLERAVAEAIKKKGLSALSVDYG